MVQVPLLLWLEPTLALPLWRCLGIRLAGFWPLGSLAPPLLLPVPALQTRRRKLVGAHPPQLPSPLALQTRKLPGSEHSRGPGPALRRRQAS